MGRAARIILLAIVLAAAAFRFVGLSFGFPQVGARPDELGVVVVSLHAATGNFDPVYFNYPTLFMYVNGAVDFVYCAGRVAQGAFPSVAACADPAREDWEPFFLIARTLSALAGTAAVATVFFLGRRFGRTAAERDLVGLTAAALLAVNVLHVRDSHFSVTDIAMATGVLLSVLLLCRAHERPSWRRFLVAGLAGGAAASLKYNGALLAAPVIASQALEIRDAIRQGRRPDVRLLVFGAAAAAMFVVGTPYALVHWQDFIRDVGFEAHHLRVGHDRIVGDIGWVHHALVTLPAGAGWALMATAVAGLVWSARQDRASALLVFAFPVVYYAVAGQGYTVFSRYMVPMIPFVCIAAAVTMIPLWRAGRPVAVVASLAVAAIAALHVREVVMLDRLLRQTDSRVLTTEWVWQHLPARAALYLSGSEYARPPLHHPGQRTTYELWTWDYKQNRFSGPGGERGEWPEWMLMQESPLKAYDEPPPAVLAGLDRYELVQRFDALGDRPHVYDQQDGWYLPLDGYAGVIRPGPTVSIYRRR